MALHPELLKGTGNDYVFIAYTYVDKSRGGVAWVKDPTSPYHDLYTKIVRLTYDKDSGTLKDPVELIAGLPGKQRPQLRPHEDRPRRQALLHHRRRR